MLKKIVILIMVLLLVACADRKDGSNTVFYSGKDSYGRDVVLQKEPQRVVSLSPAITEMMYLLGAEDKLVGVSSFCTFPPEVERIPKVADLLNVNPESVLALNPDLILIGSVVSDKTVKQFEKAQVPVFAVKEERHLADMTRMVETLGVLLNKKSEADSLKKVFERRLERYQSEVKPMDKKVYYVVGYGLRDFTAAGNTFIHDIITLAGGKNVGAPLTSWEISREYLFEQDPDYIFIRKEDMENFCKTYPYTLLTAVKENRVYPIESGWIDILSPRNYDAVEYISSVIAGE